MKRIVTYALIVIYLPVLALGQGLEEARSGVAAFKKGEIDLAIEFYTRALRANDLTQKDRAGVLFNRGLAHSQKFQLDRAIEDFNAALRIDLKFAAAFSSRGVAYHKKKQTDLALADYNAAIELDPKDAKAYSNRGMLFTEVRQYNRAIEDYEMSIRLDPNDPVVFNNLGNTFRSKGDYTRAFENLDRAIRLFPRFAAAYYNRGIAYWDQSAYERAIQDYNSAIGIDPNFALAVRNRGIARYYLGDFSSAEKDLNRSIELRPDDPYANLWLFLNRSRSGLDAKSNLEKRSQTVNLDEWPWQLIAGYLGIVDVEKVLFAAKAPESHIESERQFEAYFYLAQYAIVRGDRIEGSRLFKAARETGVTSRFEFSAIRTELGRLLP